MLPEQIEAISGIRILKMSEKERDAKGEWIDPDDAPEWTGEMFDRAQISVGGVVICEATGTLTKRGRPPVGDAPKQQVTLRLPRHVLEHFKAGGAGWQSRLSLALEAWVAGQGGPTRSSVAEAQAPYVAGQPARKRR